MSTGRDERPAGSWLSAGHRGLCQKGLTTVSPSTSLDSNNNDKGSRAVKATVPSWSAWLAAGRHVLDSGSRRLLDQSLVLYLLFVVAARAWVLLNTDVTQLVRRIH